MKYREMQSPGEGRQLIQDKKKYIAEEKNVTVGKIALHQTPKPEI